MKYISLIAIILTFSSMAQAQFKNKSQAIDLLMSETKVKESSQMVMTMQLEIKFLKNQMLLNL